MCTITFIPVSAASRKFILTSNRDEAVDRKTLLPKVYVEDGVKLLFPKDAVGGGTWIGLSERQRLVCLMNGGFEKHVRKPPYRKSRGLVVKSLLIAEDCLAGFDQEDLGGTEPFTCVVVEWITKLELYQLVWDGTKKHSSKMPLQKHIFGSSFLYSPEIRKRREQLFREFVRNSELDPEALMKFHSSEGDDSNEGLIIDQGMLKTCSITQIVKTSEETKMIYKDLLQKEQPVSETLVDF